MGVGRHFVLSKFMQENQSFNAWIFVFQHLLCPLIEIPDGENGAWTSSAMLFSTFFQCLDDLNAIYRTQNWNEDTHGILRNETIIINYFETGVYISAKSEKKKQELVMKRVFYTY